MALQRPTKSPSKKRFIVWGSAIFIGVLAALVATWLYYSQNVTNAPAAVNPASEAAPEKHQVDTTKPKKPDAAVPAWHPVSLTIATVGVESAPIIPVGVDPSGEMEAPAGLGEVGWYSKSATPADSAGAVLLDGHVGLEGQSAVFKNLHQLRAGSVIKVATQDGSTHAYEVYYVEQMPLEDVDMRKMMRSVNPSKQGLNIITCAGEYDTSRDTYDERVLVYAVRT